MALPLLTLEQIQKYVKQEDLDEILTKYPDALKVLVEPPTFNEKSPAKSYGDMVSGVEEPQSYSTNLTDVASLAHSLLPNDFSDAAFFETQLRTEMRTELANFLTDLFSSIELDRKSDQDHALSELTYARVSVNMNFASCANLVKVKHQNAAIAAIDEKYKSQVLEAKQLRWCSHCLKKVATAVCCFNAAFCSQKCQKKHWIDHVLDCCRVEDGANDVVNDENASKSE